MRSSTTFLAALLATQANAARETRAHSVLRFINGNGNWLTTDMADPIVNPGVRAAHHHGIQGGSAFSLNNTGEELLRSKCTTAKIKNDFSNYWVPTLWFEHPETKKFALVPMFYMNVYYFMEPTDDEIQPFPVGLKMLVGDASRRTPPATGSINLDPKAGPIQPVQFVCPRYETTPPNYPAGSDGTMAGIQDKNDKGAGAGFPVIKCPVGGAPLRQDIHFPSCYKPDVGLDDYTRNMEYPTYTYNSKGQRRENCCKGCVHVPHIFFEVYWDTPLFDGLWQEDGKNQPFLFANGDRTGYSSHGDFHAAWDLNTLKTIIDTCDASKNSGGNGMDACPNIPGGLNDAKSCSIPPPTGDEPYKPSSKNNFIWYDTLPGNPTISGWGRNPGAGGNPGVGGGSGSGAASSSTANNAAPTKTAGAVPTPTNGGNNNNNNNNASVSAKATATGANGETKPTGKPPGRPSCGGRRRSVHAEEPALAAREVEPVAVEARHAHEHMLSHQARHRYNRR